MSAVGIISNVMLAVMLIAAIMSESRGEHTQACYRMLWALCITVSIVGVTLAR